jgi:N-acetylmuramoyl-L-alanine amidase
MHRHALGVLILGSVHALIQPPRIIDRPLPFGAHRAALTLRYIQTHYDTAAQSIVIHPRMIVLHATETPSRDSTLRLFDPDELPAFRSDIARGGAVNVSAHYLVDRDGTIYRLLPDTIMARHVIGLNRLAIGIENVGGIPDVPLTNAQIAADAWLVRHLVNTHPAIHYLIGHDEYTNFRHTPLWEERDSTYLTPKHDPGPVFMDSVRNRVTDLSLSKGEQSSNRTIEQSDKSRKMTGR